MAESAPSAAGHGGAHREAHETPACQPRERAHVRERWCCACHAPRSARWGSAPRTAVARAGGARGWALCLVALAVFPQAALAFRTPLPSTAALSFGHPLDSRPLPALQRARRGRGAAGVWLGVGSAVCGLGRGGGTKQAASAVRGVFGACGARLGEGASGARVGLRFDAHASREVRQRLSQATATHAARRGSGGGSSSSGGSGGGRQGSGRRSSGDDGFEDRQPTDKWNGPLDAQWELRARAARSPNSARGVVRDPWQDKQVKRVLLPSTPHQAMLQAVDAVDHALDQGVFRLRVQMNLAELDLHQQSLSQSSLPVLVNKLATMLLARGLRVCLLFNTLRDASDAKLNLHPDLDGKVAISVLGLGDFGEAYDVAVLVGASNEGDENLQRIEEVERLIYAGPPKDMTKKVDKLRYMQRPIILINPALEAIHSMASASRKVKPMFMSDFKVVYFLQTHSASTSLDAALFKSIRQVPETWQVWVREYTGEKGRRGDMTAADSTACSVETQWGGHSAIFTLILEKKTFPSDMDLAYMTDISSLEWLASASRSL